MLDSLFFPVVPRENKLCSPQSQNFTNSATLNVLSLYCGVNHGIELFNVEEKNERYPVQFSSYLFGVILFIQQGARHPFN